MSSNALNAKKQSGTAVAKFQPPQGTDTNDVKTKQQCITKIKKNAKKSLEELRKGDYANRKGPQADASSILSAWSLMLDLDRKQLQKNEMKKFENLSSNKKTNFKM